MKLCVLLLIAPGCFSRRHPQSGRIASGELHLPLDRRELNLTSLNRSIADIDRTSDLGSVNANWPSDSDYNKLVEQGCSLIGMMSTRDAVAARFIQPVHTHTTAASSWTNFQSMQDWGWELDFKLAYEAEAELLKPSLDPAMHDLGLPPLDTTIDGGFAAARIWQHSHDTTHEGVLYRSTGAKMEYLVDVHHGVLVCTSRYGPAYKGKQQNPPVTVLPKLKAFYDLLYLDYAHLAADAHEPVNKLKYMFVFDVQNELTKEAVDNALGEELTDFSCHDYLWSNRRTFHPDDEGYKALIASPNGRSFALLLATHKSVFGERRMIESVSVFCQNEDYENYNLLFTVKGHDEEDDDTDWNDEREPESPGPPDFSVSPWPSPTP